MKCVWTERVRGSRSPSPAAGRDSHQAAEARRERARRRARGRRAARRTAPVPRGRPPLDCRSPRQTAKLIRRGGSIHPFAVRSCRRADLNGSSQGSVGSAGLQVRMGGRECSSGFRSRWARLYLALKDEKGQGATEYAMVIGFLVVGLGVGLAPSGRRHHGLPRPRQGGSRRPRRYSVGTDGAWTVGRAQHGSDCATRGTSVRRAPLRLSTTPRRGSFERLRAKALRAPAGAGGCGPRAVRRQSSSQWSCRLSVS